MLSQPVSYDWSIIEDAEWELAGFEATEAAGRNTAALSERWALLQLARGLVLIVAALALTGATFAPEPAERTWAYEMILPTLQLETKAWATRDEDLLASLVDGYVQPRFQDEWRVGWNAENEEYAPRNTTLLNAEAVSDLIQVQVKVEQVNPQWWISSPHRETRFYRQVGAGWVRTVPTAEFWGEQRVLETNHLRFEFYDHDLPAVLAMVDRVETAYVQAHAWLGIPVPKEEEKITFAIRPDLVRGWSGSGNRLHLTTPALARVPAELSDADYLAHQLISRVTTRTFNRLFTDYERTNTYQWRTMLWALNGWVRSELVGQRSPWHQQAELLFEREMANKLPLRLSDIENRYPSWRVDQQGMMLDYVRAESVVVYTMNELGRDRLRELVMAFHQHGSWIGLVTDLFGVTVAEFEAGWNDYLTERYQRAP
ncbi:MAG: hypothetical protein DCC55_25795 [Chloroflexi bacterium]|nr:MAG: hypothetical protein DCC55_25795 [Chloroflexota bacterium]